MFLIPHIFHVINWLVVILLVFLGIVASVAILEIAIVLAIAGLIISPTICDLIEKKFHVTVSFHSKAIIVLFSLVVIAVSVNQSNNQQLGSMIAGLFLSYEDDDKLNRFLEMQQQKEEVIQQKQKFYAMSQTLIPQLRSLYNSGNYGEVIEAGKKYVEFDTTVKKLVEDATQNLKQQKIESALQNGLQLLEEGNFYEAYDLTNELTDIPGLKDIADKAKAKREETFEKVKSLYEKGKYDNVLAQGLPFVDYDCRLKQLVSAAEKAKARKKELEEIERVSKTLAKLMRSRQYEKAYEIAKDYTDPLLQEVATQAKTELDETAEKRILARLKLLSASNNYQQQVEEYAKLVNIFPDNQDYRNKLTFYRDRLAKTRKETNRISQKDYGEQWPFTVASAELSCASPGIVTLWANDKTYALNELASSRGYAKIDEILKSPDADTILFISKGLALCQ